MKKPTHGGSRPGAGRKPTGEAAKESTGIRLSPEVLRYLRENGVSVGEFVEATVRRTKAFKEWLKQQGD